MLSFFGSACFYSVRYFLAEDLRLCVYGLQSQTWSADRGGRRLWPSRKSIAPELPDIIVYF